MNLPRAPSPALWRHHPLRAAVALGLLAAALAAYAAGVALPILTLEKLVFAHHTYSILGGLAELWRLGHWPLFLLVGLFSLVFPLAKILALMIAWMSPPHTPALDWLDGLGRWSMLDVFVVAVLIASVQLGVLARVEVHAGIYAFAGCVLLSMAAAGLTRSLAKR